MTGARMQKFSFDKAKELESRLENEFRSIEQTLNKTQRLVESVRDWWQGGSEGAFINNFADTKKSVSKDLEQWLQGYKKLIQEVANTKLDQDQALSNALNKR